MNKTNKNKAKLKQACLLCPGQCSDPSAALLKARSFYLHINIHKYIHINVVSMPLCTETQGYRSSNFEVEGRLPQARNLPLK